MRKEEIIAVLKEQKSFLNEKFHIKSLELFGSFARGENSSKSDIDILVEFYKSPDLLEFIAIEEYLSKKLQRKVDLVIKRKLKEQLKEQILKEAIAI
jgi:predicted nucleotidyltransferase